ELQDVLLDAARRVQRVRAGQRDPHEAGPSSHAGWNICQSAGDSEIDRSKPAPTSLVSAATSARRFPVRSIVSGVPMWQSHPLSVVNTAATHRGAPVERDRSAGPA